MPQTLILADPDHPSRAMLERAVRQVFLAEYGAHVPAFPTRLLASLDALGQPLAVTGLRFAEDGLFSETYLDLPAEQAVSAAFGQTVARTCLVEFSSMASLRPGAALALVGVAIRLCLASGMTHGLFTATATLRALLRRAGFSFADLGPARPERLADAGSWGSYYLHDPRVVAVSAHALTAIHPLVSTPLPALIVAPNRAISAAEVLHA